MEGSVRITVLATGFEPEAGAPAAKAAATETPRETAAAAAVAAVAAPAATEPQPEAKEETPARRGAFQEEPTYDEDDIDIPAFLRRR